MINQNYISDHVLSIFEKELQDKILSSRFIKLGKGEIIVKQESYLNALPFLLKGNLRAYRRTEDREILLYYVHAGESCMISLVSCFEQRPVHIEIVAAEDSEIVLIPREKVIEWQRLYSSWNDFVIKTFSSRHDQLLKSLDALAFSKMDQRIKDHLIELSGRNPDAVVNITHQELANELGTTRVVISRILKCLELEGAVELLRGAIKVKNLKLN